MKKILSKEYKLNKQYYEMNTETQYMINVVMTLLDAAHVLDLEHNLTGRELIKAYSPDNEILDNNDFISWGCALHTIITDVIQERDLLSQASKSSYLH